MEKEAETMERYMIREAAKQVGVEPPVLRYWEKELLLEIPKNEMGHRYYTTQEITLLRQVKYLKDQGFHLKSVRMLKDNVPKVAQMEMGRLHSLRDRLNGQLMAEAAGEGTSAEETWKGKTNAIKSEKKEEKKTNVFPVKGTPAGMPAGKVVGTKLTMVSNDDRTMESMEEKREKKERRKEIKKDTENVKTQLLELELAEPKAEKEQEQEVTRSFNVVQGGLSSTDKEVPVTAKDISNEQIAETDMNGRMEQFRMIMNDIIGEALRDNNKELVRDVGINVSERVIKEMDFMMRSQQEEEEKRYRKLDETIRSCQRSRQEAAAAAENTKKRKKGIFSFRKSGKQA